MRFLSADEVLALAETIDPRYRAFVLLGGYGGLRLGEMLGLRWGRVDLLRRRVQVAETLVDIDGHISFGPPKTRAAVRSVPLPRVRQRGARRLAVPGIAPEMLVFRSPEGLPGPSHLLPPPLLGPRPSTAAGLAPLRIHDLRHTAVSLWIADGGRPQAGRGARRPHLSRRSCSTATATSTRSRTRNSWSASSGEQLDAAGRDKGDTRRERLRFWTGQRGRVDDGSLGHRSLDRRIRSRSPTVLDSACPVTLCLLRRGALSVRCWPVSPGIALFRGKIRGKSAPPEV